MAAPMTARAPFVRALLGFSLAVAATPIPAQADAQAPPAVKVQRNAEWSIRLPEGEKVPFRGLANLDGAGMGTASMLYPAPNAGGLIVAVITHGLISESSRNSQKDKLQEEADKVLSPYQGVLAAYAPRELITRALARIRVGGAKNLLEGAGKPAAAWLIETAPVFAMTQDQAALILETPVAIYPPGADAPAYRNIVKVVSAAARTEDFAAYWGGSNGERLKDETARLLAHSVDMALDDAERSADAGTAPQRTFRYLQGKSEKFERARLVAEGCDRVVIRTLRGWLMSVPARHVPDAPTSCAGS